MIRAPYKEMHRPQSSYLVEDDENCTDTESLFLKWTNTGVCLNKKELAFELRYKKKKGNGFKKVSPFLF